MSRKRHRAGFGSREEVKGFDFDNMDSSLDFGSNKSVSDSEESKKANQPIEASLYDALFAHTKPKNHKKIQIERSNRSIKQKQSIINNSSKHLLKSHSVNKNEGVFDKEEVEIIMNEQKFLLRNKAIQWAKSEAMLHIIEDTRGFNTECINPYLNNDHYKLILRQFASELRRLLTCIMNEITDIDQNGRQFKNLRKSMKLMSSMVEEVISIITYKDGEDPTPHKEAFNIRNLCDEVYNMMASRIEEKKLDYIQTIAPELENVSINSDKTTIKQIMLNLIANALLNTDKGHLKVECMSVNDDKSYIKVCISDDGNSIGKEEAKRINKLLAKQDINSKNIQKSEGSNLLLSKVLTERLGGKIWVDTDFKNGNSVTFTIKVDPENEELSFEEEDMEVSDSGSDKEGAKIVPTMH